MLINRDLTDQGVAAPTVTIDERVGGRAAVRHLYDLGHRRITYVGGPARSWSQAHRASAIRRAAAALEGVVLTGVGSFAPDAVGGRAAAVEVMASSPTAVIAYNDLQALGLLARWSEAGIRVPDDVSLVGFDNTFVAELSSPRLTSVGADLREFGERAVELLIDRIDRHVAGAPLHHELVPVLAIRDSTAVPGRTSSPDATPEPPIRRAFRRRTRRVMQLCAGSGGGRAEMSVVR